MTRAALIAMAFAGPLLCAACVSRETLRATFREERDQCVGRIFMDPASSWCHWSDAIVRRPLSAAAEEYEMAPDYMGSCRWVYVVDRESRRVLSWRYASGAQACYERIDWLGPW